MACSLVKSSKRGGSDESVRNGKRPKIDRETTDRERPVTVKLPKRVKLEALKSVEAQLPSAVKPSGRPKHKAPLEGLVLDLDYTAVKSTVLQYSQQYCSTVNYT